MSNNDEWTDEDTKKIVADFNAKYAYQPCPDCERLRAAIKEILELLVNAKCSLVDELITSEVTKKLWDKIKTNTDTGGHKCQ
jgi:hypothetical protein